MNLAGEKQKEVSLSIQKKAKSELEKVKKVVDQHKLKMAKEQQEILMNMETKLKLAEEKREKNLDYIKKHATEIGQRKPSKDIAPHPDAETQ